ncbi:hypothetical protein VitviT2T_017933 [Vitis vinifera]|uniref:Uncharacterized protein n=1 Tax=Vitis vinifera TaxID=29760 RepID=A0ABY9CVY6_VITVI|nr:hypothetical protein VitviT2T_017933 [Vitis vinifera]
MLLYDLQRMEVGVLFNLRRAWNIFLMTEHGNLLLSWTMESLGDRIMHCNVQGINFASTSSSLP